MNQRDLQRKLQLIRSVERGIKPDPAWVSRTRETLLMQAGNSLSNVPAPVTRRIREFWQQFVPTQFLEYLSAPLLAGLSILAIVAGGSIASVSAAEQALPGDFLYPVKLATEQTKLIFAKSKTDKLKIKTGFVERRVKEIQVVATSDVSEKGARIKVAAETLRRDLDTVKNQLNEVSVNQRPDQVKEVAEAAKLVDQKSAQVVETLKDVKATLPEEAKGKVTEVETAAVVTGVKAVQVLIDSHTDPAAKDVITPDELSQAIQGKVEGIENQIASTAQKIILVNGSSTGTTDLLTVSSTIMALDTATTSAVAPLLQIKNAQQSLQEAKELLQQNKLDEVKDKLGEAAKAVTVAETVADVALQAVSTSTAAIPPSSSASSSAVQQPSSSSSSVPMPSSKQATPGG